MERTRSIEPKKPRSRVDRLARGSARLLMAAGIVATNLFPSEPPRAFAETTPTTVEDTVSHPPRIPVWETSIQRVFDLKGVDPNDQITLGSFLQTIEAKQIQLDDWGNSLYTSVSKDQDESGNSKIKGFYIDQLAGTADAAGIDALEPYYLMSRRNNLILQTFNKLVSDTTETAEDDPAKASEQFHKEIAKLRFSIVQAEEIRKSFELIRAQETASAIIEVPPGGHTGDAATHLDEDVARINELFNPDGISSLRALPHVFRLNGQDRYGIAHQGRSWEGAHFTVSGSEVLPQLTDLISPIALVEVNMDTLIKEHPLFIKIALAHEILGHGMDPFTDPFLAILADPTDIAALFRIREEVLSNEFSGARDRGIPDLFKPLIRNRANPDFYDSQEDISREQFEGVINEYPLGYIFDNRKHQRADGSPISMYREVLETSKTEDFSQNPYAEIHLPEELLQRNYASYEDFRTDFEPFIKQAAKIDRRSQLIVLGMERFSEYFSNSDVVDPKLKGATGSDWMNLYPAVMADVVIYHGFLNNVPEITSKFTDQEQILFKQAVAEARQLYRKELLAEGIGFSYALWQRLGDNPFKEYILRSDLILKHMLDKDGSEVKAD